ncbi:MAG: hypothetical protein RSE45_04005 [Bacilli bacterium]
MKKQWNNPNISNIGLKETQNHTCPYRADGNTSTFSTLTAEQCCPCTDPGLASCTKEWKYIGACKS